MPFITWQASLNTGVESIDSQHKVLVRIINDLAKANAAGEGHTVLVGIFNDLVDYTHTHFNDEESLMKEHDYDDFSEHRAEHRRFTDQIEMHAQRFEAGSLKVDDNLLTYLKSWLLTHIMSTDRGYIPTFEDAGLLS